MYMLMSLECVCVSVRKGLCGYTVCVSEGGGVCVWSVCQGQMWLHCEVSRYIPAILSRYSSNVHIWKHSLLN
jgi:hypothetical protein